MPYSTNSSAKKSIPSLKNLTEAQVTKFRKIFNALVGDGMSESKAIPLAISRAKGKVNKTMNKLEKELTENIKSALNAALNDKYEGIGRIWVIDYDEENSLAYFEVWKEDAGYSTYQTSYARDGLKIFLGSDLEEVIRSSNYSNISNDKNVHNYANPFSDRVLSDIEKATEGDKRYILSNAVEKKFSVKDVDNYNKYYAWLDDYDEEYVYWSIQVGSDYKCFKTPYTYTGNSAVIGEDMVEVTKMTEYEEIDSINSNGRVFSDIEKSTKKGSDTIVDKIVYALDKYFGGSNKNITKSYNEDRITVEPLYIGAYEVDGVGDAYYNSDECYKMVDNLNDAIQKGISGNYFHKAFTDDFEPVEAFCHRVDTTIADTDIVIPANQPVVVLKYNNEKTFELRKSGELMGPSIGARAEEIVDVDTGNVISKNSEIILGSELINDEDAVVKRLLKGINFNFDNCHIALTEESQGGACSLKNDYYLAKANYKKKLTKEQKELLEKMGHDISEIEKSMEEVNKSSASDGEASEVNQSKTNEGIDDNMSEKLMQEMAELRKELAVSKTENSLTKYELDAELKKELAEVLAQVDNKEVVLKAFDAFISASESELEKVKEQHKEDLEKAKMDAVEEIKKAKAEKQEDNPLLKALSEEVGEGKNHEEEVEKSRTERVSAYLPKSKKESE